MEFIKEFISNYATEILYYIITAIAGYLGIKFKNIYQKYINDKTKRDVAKTCVQAVEQIYKDIHGDEKLQKAFEFAEEMLKNKNIYITDTELKTLLEAAVSEFNDAFNKTTTTDIQTQD